MKKILRILFISTFLIPAVAKAQFETFKDSVVQLFGVVMTADSLKAVPYASVVVKGQNRGTFTNEQGVFSIVVLKGDHIEFSCVGYKPKLVEIPKNLDGNQQSIVQLMVEDTVYLPASIIKARPTRAQFERDFVNAKIPDDQQEIIRKNNSAANRRALMAVLPSDGKEVTSNYLRQTAQKYYYAGQTPPMNIFNPAAWSEFIKAWKRGDYKSKSN